MGGSIRVIHIMDGKIDKQTRWTNSLPEYVKSPGFIKADKQWITEYLNRESMYRQKKESFAPDGYGLDLYDFDKKEIHTCQGYSSYEGIDYISISLWLHGQMASIDTTDNKMVITPSTKSNSGEYYYPDLVRQMWNEDILVVNTLKDPEGMFYGPNIIPISKADINLSFDEVLKIMEKFEEKRFGRSKKKLSGIISNGFGIRWNDFGWNYTRYEESLQGVKEFYKYVQGFYKLEEGDESQWKKEMRRWSE